MKKQTLIQQGLMAFVALWMCGAAQQARASTVFWGSEFNDFLYNSSGVVLDTTYSFEIGSFGSFIPTYGNVEQWVANWKVFDRAFDPDANGWNATEQFFTGTVNHNSDGTSDSPDAAGYPTPTDVFAQNETAYLWVYNSKDIVPTSEWALLGNVDPTGDTGNLWSFPDPLDPPGTSYNWNLADADTSVIGGVNNIQGPGDYTSNPGTFSLQTAVVPEPGSAILLLSAAGLLSLRRRKAVA